MSEIDLSAEAYFLTEFSRDKLLDSTFFVEYQGTQTRGRNKEVLDRKQRSSVVGKELFNLDGIEVSRNGMYDLLPETLFHSLVFSKSSANTYEIIQEIRDNRELEARNRQFFVPFDTELFRWKAGILETELDTTSIHRHLLKDFFVFLDLHSNSVAQSSGYALLEALLQVEKYRDHPIRIGKLLADGLDSQVVIRKVTPQQELDATPSLGGSTLGVSSILAGPIYLEGDDWEIRITTDDQELLDRAARDQVLNEEIIQIVELFALAQREIQVRWVAATNLANQALGTGRLGISLLTQTAS